jgi:hypothetical protein
MRSRDIKQSDYERCFADFESSKRKVFDAIAEMDAALDLLKQIVHSESIPNLPTALNQSPNIPLELDTSQRHGQLADDFLAFKKSGMPSQNAWEELSNLPETLLSPDTVRDIVSRQIASRIKHDNQLLNKKYISLEERVKLLSEKYFRAPSRVHRLLAGEENKGR